MRSVLSRRDGVAASTEFRGQTSLCLTPAAPGCCCRLPHLPFPMWGAGVAPPGSSTTLKPREMIFLWALRLHGQTRPSRRDPLCSSGCPNSEGLLCPGAQGHPARLLQAGGESCGLWSRSSALSEPVCTAAWRCRPLRRGLPGRGGVCSRRSTWSAGGGRRSCGERGRAASGPGRARGAPGGPGPASRGKSRLPVTNSFPGSPAGAAARAASQPSIPGGFLACLRPPLLLHPVVTSHLGGSRL